MKHIFIVNPCAGPKDATSEIQQQIAQLPSSYSTEIYTTRSAGDATRYVREQCQANPDQQLRFYACGGDGTISEVVSGIVGQPNAEMTCYPSGSGNDFVKYYGGRDTFLDLKRLVDGDVHEIDVMRIGDRYSLNICNFGFDAVVCRTMEQVRRKPIIGGRNAYTTGVLHALFHARKNECRMEVDGQLMNDQPFLLCTIANGQYVGGAYRCAPRSVNDDGMAEICLVSPVSLFQFVRLVRAYAQGRHLDDPRFAPYIHYRRGSRITLSHPSPFWVTLDGDMILTTHCEIEEMQQAVRFVVPKEK